MSLINKIANFKSSVKYHKFMVLYSFYKEFINLLLLKQFGRKTINIIILPEHIGDVLAFTPFAEKLKKEDKNAYNVWLIKPTYLSILSENNFIDKCISISCDGVAEKFSNLKKFNIFDVRFNGNNFCSICHTERKYQTIDNSFTLDNYYEYGSLLEIFSQIAKKPMKKEDWFPTLNIPKNLIDNLAKYNLPTNYICIHTTSNDINREWQNEKWLVFLNRLIETHNIKIVQIGLNDTLKFSNTNYFDLCGKLSLMETAQVIQKSDLFVGIDSGPAHFANALKVKSLILLGKYRNIIQYMPFSGNFALGINSKIMYDSTIKSADIEAENVYFETIKLLNKTLISN